MTDTSYEIVLNVKIPAGWHTFGYFQVGHDKQQALNTFNSLFGLADNQEAALRIELLEHEPAGVLLIAQKGCSLDELGENTRIMARDIFKHLSLE